MVRGFKRIGVEVKRTTAPKTTRSLTLATEALALTRCYLVHAGSHKASISRTARVRARSAIWKLN